MAIVNDKEIMLVGLKGDKGEKGEPSPGIQNITVEEATSLFDALTWSEIAQISESGEASQKFSVGNEKTITLSTGEKVTLVILGFDHDDLSDGSGKAGMTIGMKELLAEKYKMSEKAGGWDKCDIRTSKMPTLFLQLPTELQSVIKQVNKKSSGGAGITSITTSADKLWLLAVSEIFSATSVENSTSSIISDYADIYNAEGTQYKYYENLIGDNNGGTKKNSLLIKKLSNGSGEAYHWWLRTSAFHSNGFYKTIGSDGDVSNRSLTYADGYGICFGFCV